MSDAVIHVVGAAIIRDGRCLVTQRAGSAGEWEFPGGKVEPGELPRQALAREIAEELGLRIEPGELLGEGQAAAAGRVIKLQVYACAVSGGQLMLREHVRSGWFLPGELDGLRWSAADTAVVGRVRALLARG